METCWVAVKVFNKEIADGFQKLAMKYGFVTNELCGNDSIYYVNLNRKTKCIGWNDENGARWWNIDNAEVMSIEDAIVWLEKNYGEKKIKVGEHEVVIEKGQVNVGCQSFSNKTLREFKRRIDNRCFSIEGKWLYFDSTNQCIRLEGSNESISVEDFNKVVEQLKD